MGLFSLWAEAPSVKNIQNITQGVQQPEKALKTASWTCLKHNIMLCISQPLGCEPVPSTGHLVPGCTERIIILLN